MATTIRALAAQAPKAKLTPFEYDPGPLRDDQVEVAVTHCGICHSDLSMWENAWGMTTFPFVPGHEAVGTVVAAGPLAKRKVGETVGVGWFSESCQNCPQCLTGKQNLCGTAEQTIVGRHGGFASRVRCHWAWAVPLPAGVDMAKAGPLFCGGITVFNPIVMSGVQPTDRVGVIGIGGLGHMALQFLNKWGCEVVAFSSNPAKREEILKMGAHHVVDSRDANAMAKLSGSLNFVLSTVNVPLDWNAVLGTVAPRGTLHVVGAVLEPIPVPAFGLIMGEKRIAGSPLGGIQTVATMLEFCARHGIAPVTETFPMSQANEAFEHLESGKARYRIVLQNDLA